MNEPDPILVFVTDESVQGSGFKINYDTLYTNCGGKFTANDTLQEIHYKTDFTTEDSGIFVFKTPFDWLV